jgi:hypothetical protein
MQLAARKRRELQTRSVTLGTSMILAAAVAIGPALAGATA